MINRKTFFDNYHSNFGSLNDKQVSGLIFLLDKLDNSKVFMLANEYAYILATIYHECAVKWQPITEMGSQRYLQAKRYFPYIGRGFVQLTWDFNYSKFGKLLQIDLLTEPDLALEPETAWQILEIGMSKGLYTGKKLSTFCNENITDYNNARKVINGKDQSNLIANFAKKFEDCIFFNEIDLLQ